MKVEQGGCRFTGIYVQNTENRIIASMEIYKQSIEEIWEIRKGNKD